VTWRSRLGILVVEALSSFGGSEGIESEIDEAAKASDAEMMKTTLTVAKKRSLRRPLSKEDVEAEISDEDLRRRHWIRSDLP